MKYPQTLGVGFPFQKLAQLLTGVVNPEFAALLSWLKSSQVHLSLSVFFYIGKDVGIRASYSSAAEVFTCCEPVSCRHFILSDVIQSWQTSYLFCIL